jgi:hypothetical protein
LAPLPNKAEKYIYSDNTYDLHSGGARFEYWSGIWLIFSEFLQSFQTNPNTEHQIRTR